MIYYAHVPGCEPTPHATHSAARRAISGKMGAFVTLDGKVLSWLPTAKKPPDYRREPA